MGPSLPGIPEESLQLWVLPSPSTVSLVQGESLTMGSHILGKLSVYTCIDQMWLT